MMKKRLFGQEQGQEQGEQRKKGRVPRDEPKYVARKDHMNRSIVSTLGSYGFVERLVEDRTQQVLVLDDLRFTDKTVLNTCGYLQEAGLLSQQLVVANPDPVVINTGAKQGIVTEQGTLDDFLDNHPTFRTSVAILDFCQAWTTIESTVARVLADHLRLGQRALVLVTFCNQRAAYFPTTELVQKMTTLFRDYIPACFRFPTWLQCGPDEDGRMFQTMFVLEPIKTVAQTLFRDELVGRSVYLQHDFLTPFLQQERKEDGKGEGEEEEDKGNNKDKKKENNTKKEAKAWLRGIVLAVRQPDTVEVQLCIDDGAKYVERMSVRTLFAHGSFRCPSSSSSSSSSSSFSYSSIKRSLLRGKRIQKQFLVNDTLQWFCGTVGTMRYVEGAFRWRIHYEDGDEEELTHEEIVSLLLD